MATAKSRRAQDEDGAGPEVAVAAGDPPARKSKLGLWIGLAVLVVAAAGGGLWFWQSSQTPATEESAEAETILPLLFFSMDPPFVANFDGNQDYRFLQVTVRIATRDPEFMTLLRDNEPVLRNDLLMLFSNQQSVVLATIEGKEALREDATRVIRDSITSLSGDPSKVERVLFTSLVMQ